jgi:hypothetical protein
MSGFTLNKDVKRYSGEWFSSHRTMIRVHDPRGFEFEVTTENLIAILMHTDCLRRGLVGEFVYAWIGPELVLLPTNSEEYQNATKFTAGLAKKVFAKTLVSGVSYKTKREGDVIFIGKFIWYEYLGKNKYSRTKGPRGESKVMVFTNDDGKTFFKKTSAEFLAEANSDHPVSNFSELVEKFNQNSYANKIVRFEFRPVTFDPKLVMQEHYGPRLKRQGYFVESSLPGVFVDSSVQVRTEHKNNADGSYCPNEYDVKGYEYSRNYSSSYYSATGVRQSDGELVEVPAMPQPDIYYFHHDRKPYDLAHMQSEKFYDLYVVFENNKQKRVSTIYELTGENY